jgi:uncharacterized protein YqiB (DUF1249 family)
MIVTHPDLARAGLQPLPRTFAGLMDLYERNYINIRRLIPTMPPTQTCLASHVPDGLSFYMTVVERFPYTSEISLTYHFCRESGVVIEPDLRVRVYHDARLAEVTGATLRNWPKFQADQEDQPNMQLVARWHVNRFLFKWLNYCLHQGHRFSHPS